MKLGKLKIFLLGFCVLLLIGAYNIFNLDFLYRHPQCKAKFRITRTSAYSSKLTLFFPDGFLNFPYKNDLDHLSDVKDFLDKKENELYYWNIRKNHPLYLKFKIAKDGFATPIDYTTKIENIESDEFLLRADFHSLSRKNNKIFITFSSMKKILYVGNDIEKRIPEKLLKENRPDDYYIELYINDNIAYFVNLYVDNKAIFN